MREAFHPPIGSQRQVLVEKDRLPIEMTSMLPKELVRKPIKRRYLAFLGPTEKEVPLPNFAAILECYLSRHATPECVIKPSEN